MAEARKPPASPRKFGREDGSADDEALPNVSSGALRTASFVPIVNPATTAPPALVTEGKEFKAGLSRLLAASQSYAEAGKEFARLGTILADEIEAFSASEWSTQHCGAILNEIAALIHSNAALEGRTMTAMQDALDVPVFQLLEIEQLELRQLAEAKARAEEDLLSTAHRNTRKRATEREKIVDVTPLELALEQRQSEYEAQSAILDGAKKIKMFRFMRALLHAERDYFSAGWKAMSDFAPAMEQLDVKLTELEVAQGKYCKDGYVWKLSHKAGRWKRVWVVLRNGWLEVRSDSEKKRTKQVSGRNKMNLLISTVKIPMVKHSGDIEGLRQGELFEFEIVTPERKRPWILASKSDAERQEWIEALQASIGSLINNQQLQGADRQKPGASSAKDNIGMAIIRKVIPKGHRKTRSSANADSARQMAMMLMQEGGEMAVMMELALVAGNEVCADCGKTEPEWASMNLGVLFCLNCSGIHRHLGSHITKVRSLTMDKWPLWTLRYMRCLGNATANAFWEAGLTADSAPAKPRPASTQAERTEFITAKYGTQSFIVPPPQSDKAQLSVQLIQYINELPVSLTSLVPPPMPPSRSPSKSATITPQPVDSPVQDLHKSEKSSLDGLQRSGSNISPSGTPHAVRKVSHSDADLLSTASGSMGGEDLFARSPRVSRSGLDAPINERSSSRGSAEVKEPPPQLSVPVSADDAHAQAALAELLQPIYRLLCWGAELNAVEGSSGRSLLKVLLHKQDPFLLHVFLVNGLEANVVEDATGETILHYAARHNLAECLECLFTALAAQASSALRVKNHAGETPLDVARAAGAQRTLDAMLMRDKDGGAGTGAAPSPSDSPLTIRADKPRPIDGLPSPRSESSDSLNTGMMKKLLTKATGGHSRSKSVAPSAGAAVPGGAPVPRDSMMGALSSKIRGRMGADSVKTKRTPMMTAKSSLPDAGTMDAGGKNSDDDDDAPVTPVRREQQARISDRRSNSSALLVAGSAAEESGRSTTRVGPPSVDVDLGNAVFVAGKKAPLMKSKGLMDRQAILDAVREAQSTPEVADATGAAATTNAVGTGGGGAERDIMGLIDLDPDSGDNDE